jgi:hypothetical protein
MLSEMPSPTQPELFDSIELIFYILNHVCKVIEFNIHFYKIRLYNLIEGYTENHSLEQHRKKTPTAEQWVSIQSVCMPSQGLKRAVHKIRLQIIPCVKMNVMSLIDG